MLSGFTFAALLLGIGIAYSIRPGDIDDQPVELTSPTYASQLTDSAGTAEFGTFTQSMNLTAPLPPGPSATSGPREPTVKPEPMIPPDLKSLEGRMDNPPPVMSPNIPIATP